MIINIFIQARMSSARFPGKVLAPVNGIPLIKRIIDTARQLKTINKIVVLTSTELSDDPLAAYLDSINCDLFRGELDNVFNRFQSCLNGYPCDYFVRLNGDSPFLETGIIDALVMSIKDDAYDLISNVFVRTFPKGQSVEIVRSKPFLEVQAESLTEHDKEHVMPYFYNHKDKYNCLFFNSVEDLGHINMCVDTLEDLKNLENESINYAFDKSKICIATD